MFTSSPRSAAWLARAYPGLGAISAGGVAARVKAKAARSNAAVRAAAASPRVWLPGRLRPVYKAA
jgi:hypothetical protein